MRTLPDEHPEDFADLVTCPGCGERGVAAWPECPNCGHPLTCARCGEAAPIRDRETCAGCVEAEAA